MIRKWWKRWKNRRTYLKVGNAYCYLFEEYFYGRAEYNSDALDTLIYALEMLAREYYDIR